MFGGQGNFWESDISRGSHQARKTELLLMTSKHLLCSLPSLVSTMIWRMSYTTMICRRQVRGLADFQSLFEVDVSAMKFLLYPLQMIINIRSHLP